MFNPIILDKLNHSFLNGYECGMNVNKYTNEIFNFKTSENNINKLSLYDVPMYAKSSNIVNYHTHPNNGNLLTFVPSHTDIRTLINAANHYKEHVEGNILCSTTINNEIVIKKLTYSIDNIDFIEDLFNNIDQISDIFNTLHYEYREQHKNLNNYIKDYKNSKLENMIKITID